MRAFVPFLIAFVVAGCLTTPEDTTPTLPTSPEELIAWAERALIPSDENHNHRDWHNHTDMSTPNFVELAHDPLGIPEFGNRSAGGYFCGGAATTSEGRRLTVISSLDTSVAFVVVDTTDPDHPEYLGSYIVRNAVHYDVDITPDGKHVVIGADTPTDGPAKDPGTPEAPRTVLIRPEFHDACTGEVRQGPEEEVLSGPSTILVSIANPRNPTLEDVAPAPVVGPHSVSTAAIDGITYVASSITNLQNQASYYQFFRLVPTSVGARLVQVSLVDAGVEGENNANQPTEALINGHLDAEIAVHPVTKKPIVYLSNWGRGVQILDFSNPAAPLPLGSWLDSGPQGGQVHSTRSIEGVHNGHHYFLAGQEFTSHPVNRPSGWVWILDDTDPSNIKEVGRWTLPIDVESEWHGIELFSTHYFRVVGETAFVCMYHGGVWAIQLDFEHPENMKLPKSVGVFVPGEDAQEGRDPKGQYDYAPFVLDVFPFEDNTLAIYDGLSGVYMVRYDPEHPMPAPEPWPAEGRTA